MDSDAYTDSVDVSVGNRTGIDSLLSRRQFLKCVFYACKRKCCTVSYSYGSQLLQYPKEIASNFPILGTVVTVLIICCMLAGALLSRLAGKDSATRRIIVIEIGMQNAAQAIAIASSPFIFNDGEMAIPAIIYALMMNVILLLYISRFLFRKRE